MITLRKAAERGHFDFGWLDTRHTFSFGEYEDPGHMGFRSLRVINEDRVQPAQGFGTHGHRDMEILSYILSGELQHTDSLGNTDVIKPGVVQVMSAGTGIRHSEANPSRTEPVHFLQVWILPDRKGVNPRYEDRIFTLEQRRNRLCLLASPDGAEGSFSIHQDARVYATVLDAGQEIALDLAPGRAAWVQVARGGIALGHGFSAGKGGIECAGEWTELRAGDGAAAEGERKLAIRAEAVAEAEVLVFDLG
jgi:redox-sensitive bicupin YhaK (pirin superfamily)